MQIFKEWNEFLLDNMYTKIDETKGKIELPNCTFFLDTSTTDFTLLGITPDEDMLREEDERVEIHKRLLEDFEDEEKLHYFEGLLEKDPSTAYPTYINTQINKAK